MINGVKVAQNAPSISYLFFVDDNFIYCNARTGEVEEIKEIHDDYCDMSGQMVNINKLALCVGKGTCRGSINATARILGVRLMSNDEKHLGNPVFLNRRKSTNFESIVMKIKNKIASWKTPSYPSYLVGYMEG